MSEVIREGVVRVGVDLAKRVIQVHAVDGKGRVVFSRALARDKFMQWCAQLPPGCLVAMETCSGAHYWARRLTELGLDARLIAGHFVSPYRMNGRSGKNVLGRITKRGDDYLRTLLIQGAKSAVLTAHKRTDRISVWVTQLKARVGWQKAVVALANKNARILWAVLSRSEKFDADHVPVKPQGPVLTPTPPCPA